MVRKFELQAYDDKMNLLSRYLLDLTTKPQGLGFKQKVEVISTKVIDYITERALEKSDIKLEVHFPNPHSYHKIELFRNWYAKYIKHKTVLYYETDACVKWIDVYIKEFKVTEVETGFNSVDLTLQPLTPFYVLKERVLVVAIDEIGKKYPYTYPFTYTGGVIENALLNNTYFDDIPIRVRIYGFVANPQISLRDENGEIYSTVRFLNLTLQQGQILEIDAINSRIFFYRSENDTEPEDYYNFVDKTLDTFLYAKPGENTIIANLDQNHPESKLQISYVQYLV